MAGKSACVIALDVGANMDRNGACDTAKNVLRRFLQHMMLFSPATVVNILQFGHENTRNGLADEGHSGYDNIFVEQPVFEPTHVELLEGIDDIEVHDGVSADAVSAIVVSMHMLHQFVGKKKIQKKIFLLTNGLGGSLYADDEATRQQQVKQIAGGIVGSDFDVTVVGLDFLGRDNKHQRSSAKEGEEEEEGETTEEQKKISYAAGQVDLTALVAEAGQERARLLDLKAALAATSLFEKKKVKQVTKMRGPLYLGDTEWCEALPVWSYGKTMMAKPPSFKKRSAVAPGDSVAKGVARSSAYYNKMADDDDLDSGGNGAADAAAASGREVLKEDRVQAYMYGCTPVAMSGAGIDDSNLKFETQRSMFVLGFVKRKKVCRHHFLSGVDAIIAEEGNVRAQVALSALVRACKERDCVVVVRYVKRANSPPVLGVMTPVIVPGHHECFYLNQLPFLEDIRDFMFPSVDAAERSLSEEQRVAAKEFVDSMMLNGGSSLVGSDGAAAAGIKTEDGQEVGEVLAPEKTFNPLMQRLYRVLTSRVLDPDAPIEDLDSDIVENISPPGGMERDKALVGSTTKFRAAFPLVSVAVGAKAKKRPHWREGLETDDNAEKGTAGAVDADVAAIMNRSEGAAAELGADGRPAAKRLRTDMLERKVIDSVGTVDPAGDFSAMVAGDVDSAVLHRAVSQLTGRIRELITASWQGTQDAKVLGSLAALRGVVARRKYPEQYNEFIKELKAEYCTKKPDFWNKVRDAVPTLSLISSDECSESGCSAVTAAEFFKVAGPASMSAPKPVVAVEGDDDDMDLIE